MAYTLVPEKKLQRVSIKIAFIYLRPSLLNYSLIQTRDSPLLLQNSNCGYQLNLCNCCSWKLRIYPKQDLLELCYLVVRA